MTGQIRIKNLRNIVNLSFEMPDRGVWLLTAGNGAGKTSLLACMRRIGYANAFPVHFPSSLESTRLDNYSKASITYCINGEEVEYAYRGERWAPRPRRNSHLFDQFGYSSVIYVGANADRITPRSEDFNPTKVAKADHYIVDNANEIFETTKFSELKTISLTRGTGNQAFVLTTGKAPFTYHSEKHFSLGELCILKLLRAIKNCSNNSLLLIDELEMALHPRAQVKLLDYLKKESQNKSLTIIFSTHSVTLLKTISRGNIIYLQNDSGGSVEAIVGCFPTFAIGNIALEEEHCPDSVIYVEDEMACSIAKVLTRMCVQEKYGNSYLHPSVKIIPIGGFDSVINFMQRNQSILPSYVKQNALLDEDVKSDSIIAWKKSNSDQKIAKYNRLSSSISFLPWTPEVGICEHMRENIKDILKAVRVYYSDNQLQLSSQIFLIIDGKTGKPKRDAAKKILKSIIQEWAKQVAKPIDIVQDEICIIFAEHYFMAKKSTCMSLISPLIN
jgi:ABC-type cobalamin/Fe3+-siderophores transport system ATPase subunit